MQNTSVQNIIPITRLTALWALSESLLGGLLHAAHVPFRGMVISSAAVIIICLIGHFSTKRGEILKATFIVLLIKATISPHTPVAAYGGVFLQGFLGELIFLSKRFYKLSSVMLGLVVGLLTGSQRFITLTLIFGATFWDAINQFVGYIVKEFFISSIDVSIFNFSLVLMISYILIHMVFGFGAGMFASTLPQKIVSENAKDFIVSFSDFSGETNNPKIKAKTKKLWWQKPSYILFFIFSICLLLITYINPHSLNLNPKSIILMVGRSLIIMLLWFYFLSPLLTILIKKLLHKRQNEYSNELKNIISHFPLYNSAAAEIWKLSAKFKGIHRLNYFISTLIINILTLKLSD